MAWIILLAAGLLEVIWAIGLKSSHGFSNFWTSVFTIIAMVMSFILLAQALKTIPIGTAYPVWTGIGVLGTAAFGIFFLGESKDPTRIICLILVIAGITGLKLTSSD